MIFDSVLRLFRRRSTNTPVSNEDFFTSFRDLIERIATGGNAAAAQTLRDGFAGLNGLTDGWAGLMEAITRVLDAHEATLPDDQRRELRATLRSVKRIVYR